MLISPLVPEDLEPLSQLESFCFGTESWSEEQLAAQLKNPRMLNLGARNSGQLVGFVLMSLVLDEAELFQIAVTPKARKKGIARLLVSRAREELERRQIHRVMLEVRESNTSAIKLYQSCGFLDDGRRKGYYKATNSEQREDALLFSLYLVAGGDQRISE